LAKRKRLTPPDPAQIQNVSASSLRGPFSTSTDRDAPIAHVARDASVSAALDEVSQTLSRARSEGRMVLSLPLDQVVLDHMVRDRVVTDEAEMQALMQSLKARGQQMPIEVMDLGPDRYGLISGWRRCQALARLARETGDARFTAVLALLRRPSEALEAYQAMVEENEIRVGLSFYERARIVVKSVERGVFETEKSALQGLFATASRAKRSKVGSFVRIVHALEGALRFPERLSERSGLALSKALDADASLGGRLRGALARCSPVNAEAEQACLDAILKPAKKQALNPILEPVEITPSQPDARGRAVAEGVWLRTHSNGDLTLTGPGLTPEFRSALTAFLRTGL